MMNRFGDNGRTIGDVVSELYQNSIGQHIVEPAMDWARENAGGIAITTGLTALAYVGYAAFHPVVNFQDLATYNIATPRMALEYQIQVAFMETVNSALYYAGKTWYAGLGTALSGGVVQSILNKKL